MASKPAILWLRVFIEGVVIVGSILLAFGIDAWWEGRQEQLVPLAALVALVSGPVEYVPSAFPFSECLPVPVGFARRIGGAPLM